MKNNSLYLVVALILLLFIAATFFPFASNPSPSQTTSPAAVKLTPEKKIPSYVYYYLKIPPIIVRTLITKKYKTPNQPKAPEPTASQSIGKSLLSPQSTYYVLRHNIFNYNFVYLITLQQLLISLLVLLLLLVLRKYLAPAIVNYITKRTKTDSDVELIKILRPPVRFCFIILAVWIIIEILDFPTYIDAIFYRFIWSLIIFVIAWFLYRFTNTFAKWLQKVGEKYDTQIDEYLLPFITKSLKAIIFFVGVILIIQEWGYNISYLVTGLGLGALALVLAARDTLANILATAMLLIDRPFTKGDWIQTAKIEGIVEGIGFRSTRVRTFTNAVITIPNTNLAREPITNWSKRKKRRIKFKLHVSYRNKPEQLKKCLEDLRQTVKDDPDVHPDKILIYFTDFKPSSMDILFYFFTKTTVWKQYLTVQERINFKIIDILDKYSIKLAFPTHTIYMEDLKEDELKNLEDLMEKNLKEQSQTE